ncbi:MAG: putative DNA binding domain-containing protein [archaeon]|nr:putative DNA binding domain-containing protein [archaeon]
MTIRLYSPLEIQRQAQALLSRPCEDEIFEVKEKKNGFDKNELGQYFSALSNEAALREYDEAWMIFGVDNDFRPVGTSVLPTKESRAVLKKEIADLTTNRITFIEIYETFLEDKRILMFQIPAVPNLVMMYNGIAYGRDGESLVGLNLEKINRLQFRNYDWSNELVDHGLDDLDEEAIKFARLKMCQNNPHMMEMIHQWSDEEFLSRLGLVRDGRITKAAMILLGSKDRIWESELNFTLSWIQKDHKGDIVDYTHFSIPLLTSAERLLEKLPKSTTRRVLDGLYSENFPTYDPLILREAINNCIAHADYRIRSKINVIEIQNDSVLFCNPGSFLPADIEKILLSENSASLYRNKLIADTLYRLSLVDSVGMGIKRIYNSQIKRAFPLPDYTFDEFGVCLKITGHSIDDAVTRIVHFNDDLSMKELLALDRYQKHRKLSAEDVEQLRHVQRVSKHGDEIDLQEFLSRSTKEISFNTSERISATTELQARILTFLSRNNTTTIDNLAKCLEIPDRTARYNIQKLISDGKLKKDGRGRNVVWSVND